MAVPQMSDVINYLRQINIRLENTILNKVKNNRKKEDDIKNSNIF